MFESWLEHDLRKNSKTWYIDLFYRSKNYNVQGFFNVSLADGEKEIFKEKFEIDDANMTVSLVAIGGHILEKYKSWSSVFKVIPRDDDKPVLVNVRGVYEKFKETDPNPDNYLCFLVSVVKDLDAHLTAEQWTCISIPSWSSPRGQLINKEGKSGHLVQPFCECQ